MKPLLAPGQPSGIPPKSRTTLAAWKRLAVTLVVCGLGTLPRLAAAQDAVQPRTPRIVMDRHSAAIGNVLPFDEPFVITGAGGADLRQIDLWYAQATEFSGTDCTTKLAIVDSASPTLRGSRGRTVSHVAWTRPRGGNDTFWLQLQSLPPNREFTFCVRSLTTPSSADSAAFQQNAVAFLRDSIRALIGRGVAVTEHTAGELWGFHAALRAALPRVGKVVFLNDSSILRPREDPVRDFARDSTLLRQVGRVFTAFLNLEAARSQGAGQFQDVTGPFATLLQRQLDSTAISGLIRVASAVKPPVGNEAWFGNGLGTAVGLSRITRTEAEAVANGSAPISHPAIPASAIPNPLKFTLLEAGRRTRNMEETSARLDDLRNLVVWVLSDTATIRKVGVTPASLRQLLNVIVVARANAADQEANLEIIRQALQRADDQVVQTATTLASQDLSTVTISSTTSANYEARARWYIGPDVGVLYAYQSGTSEVQPYVSANFYFAPVNKRASLGGACFLTSLHCLLRRTSVSVGVTTGKFEREGRYTGPIAGRGVFVAPGFRVTDYLRLSYGAVLINTYTADTERRRRLTAVPAGSISIDFAVKDVLGGLGTALFGS
jgi:hypothetical protein